MRGAPEAVDLISGIWSNVRDSTTNWFADPGYIEPDRRVDGSTNNNLFFRLMILQP